MDLIGDIESKSQHQMYCQLLEEGIYVPKPLLLGNLNVTKGLSATTKSTCIIDLIETHFACMFNDFSKVQELKWKYIMDSRKILVFYNFLCIQFFNI